MWKSFLRYVRSIKAIRGKHVMIDRDLLDLYGVETKVINQAVKRNLRFPEEFRFQLCSISRVAD